MERAVTGSVDACPLCGQAAHVAAEGVTGYQAGRTFTIWECGGCRASFAMPRAVDEALYGRIYENIRDVPGYNRYLLYATEVLRQRNPLRYLARQEESYWAVAEFLRTGGRRPQDVKVLEVGCGMGYFTYALACAGYDATGVDLSAEAIAGATARFGPHFSTRSLSDLTADGRRYDVIVMNQLIEHVPEIPSFLAQAVALLADGGALVITTPNKTSYARGAWRTELPPVHLWWLGEEAVRHLAAAHGCTVSFLDFTAYHRWNRRIREANPDAKDRPQVFDEGGGLMLREPIRPPAPWKRVVDRLGLGTVLRALRARLAGGDRWSGPRGEVMAAVVQRARATGSRAV